MILHYPHSCPNRDLKFTNNLNLTSLNSKQMQHPYNLDLFPVGDFVLDPVGDFVLFPVGDFVFVPVGDFVLGPVGDFVLLLLIFRSRSSWLASALSTRVTVSATLTDGSKAKVMLARRSMRETRRFIMVIVRESLEKTMVLWLLRTILCTVWNPVLWGSLRS